MIPPPNRPASGCRPFDVTGTSPAVRLTGGADEDTDGGDHDANLPIHPAPAGVSEVTVEMADALFEAGCDDGSSSSGGGVVEIGFHSEAESLGDAIGSAVKDVERAGFAVARVDVEPREDTRHEIENPMT